MSIQGKVSVISGGASGIGEQCVRLFAKRGARVIFTDTNEDKAQALVESIKREDREVSFFKADISKEDEVKNLAAFVAAEFGACEVLCNNAGILIGGLAHETSFEDWERIFAVNVTGPYLCSKYFIPAMLANKKGSIINTSSISGILGDYGMAAYCATKGAITDFTRAMALDYADSGIRVNAICPGSTRTPMLLAASLEVQQAYARCFPAKRVGLPEEVAEAVAFLASDEASFVNGVTLSIDDGLSGYSGQPQQAKE
ncbi:MAG: SDR family NAD(P)-dependent oxidoreductase [Rectinemataceae bacterium]|jgi:meso-butanediol dehydrogenase/(S,S)-butanediol dehydrogenase/diacetyl reductase